MKNVDIIISDKKATDDKNFLSIERDLKLFGKKYQTINTSNLMIKLQSLESLAVILNRYGK